MSEQTITEQFPWATVGARAVIYETGSWGYVNLSQAKIAKVSKSRITLENGRVFYVPKHLKTLSELGRENYRSPELIAPDDPRIAAAEEAQRLQNLKNKAKDACKAWTNYSDDVSKAETAVKALQAFIEAHKEEQ